MDAADVVEIRLHVQRSRGGAPAALLAARGERVDDPHRRPFEEGAALAAGPGDVGARIDEEAPAERTGLLDLQRLVPLVRRVAALEHAPPADADVLAAEALAAVTEAEGLIASDGVVEHAEHDRRVARPARR